jgi:glycosyltransferase involved in cell wall biosynthesis
VTAPGVSFVVPVYNKADWLPAVLDRIAAQRGDFRRQYVFVDDGSTDASLSIVRERTAEWDNVVIETQANAGSAAATNRGIDLADMEFVKFVDADDLLHADATRLLLEALKSEEDACLAFGQKTVFDDVAALDLDAPLGEAPVRRHEKPLKHAIFRSLFNPTQFLARTAALRAVGGCDERIVFSQEYALTMRLARRWDFLELDATVAFLPKEVGTRLSTNEGRQLQRVTRAVELFLSDHPDTPWALRQRVARRMAYRAWKYHKRIDGAFWLTSPVFWRQARAWLPILGGHARFVGACGKVFDTADTRVAGHDLKEAAR